MIMDARVIEYFVISVVVLILLPTMFLYFFIRERTSESAEMFLFDYVDELFHLTHKRLLAIHL